MHLLRALVLVTVINSGFGREIDRNLRDSPGIEWSYSGDNGPEHWPGLCQKGRQQSPININTFGLYKPLLGIPLSLEGAFKTTNEFTSEWNGHAYTAQFLRPYTFGVAAGGSLVDTYLFKSLHVHWGSEHTFNKKRSSAEMHLVHYNPKYSPEEAADQDDGFAVVAVLLQEVDDPPSSAMSDFLEALTSDSDEPFKVKLRDILPKRLEPWFRYKGSLTTPGCSENVQWTVLEHVVPIRRGIIKHNRKNFEDSYRPVQPQNNRTIYKSFSIFDGTASMADTNVINPIILITSLVNILNELRNAK